MHSYAEFRQRVSTHLKSLVLVTMAFSLLRGLQAQIGAEPADSGIYHNFVSAQTALIGTSTAAQDVRLTGKVDYISGSQKESGSVEFLSRPDGTAKAKMTLPSGEHSSLRNSSGGASGNVTKNLNNEPRPIAAHNLLAPASWFFPEHLLAELSGPKRGLTSVVADKCLSTEICFISQNGLNDRTISEFMRKMSSTTISLDQSTLLPKQLDFTIRSNANRPSDSVLVQVTYDDYRVVDGHRVPFHIRQYLNGSLYLDIMLATVILNTTITPTDLTLQ